MGGQPDWSFGCLGDADSSLPSHMYVHARPASEFRLRRRTRGFGENLMVVQLCRTL